jgi:glyceraldehyde 3-phosphate dehydrogenase
MTVRVAINGFGRIGRQSLKAIIERTEGVEVVAINDLVETELNALLFRYDSTYGRYPGTVDHTEDSLIVDGREIRVLKEKDPAALPWKEMGIDIVIESTGILHRRREGSRPPRRRRRKVIISAPAKKEDVTIVLGVNEDAYDPRPTTSSATPAARPTAWRRWPRSSTTVGHRARPDEHHPLVHQRPARPRRGAQGPRRARAAGQNIIPTTTGAARALALVIPELKGKFDGFSLRVPTPTVSVVDFTASSRAGHGGRDQRRLPDRRRAGR